MSNARLAMLPRRPFRESGKPAHTARNAARRDGKSSIPMVNHFRADLGIPKMHGWATFGIADGAWASWHPPRPIREGAARNLVGAHEGTPIFT
jgi:hypothetical protein